MLKGISIHGTPVTPESFAQWKAKFDAEMEAKKKDEVMYGTSKLKGKAGSKGGRMGKEERKVGLLTFTPQTAQFSSRPFVSRTRRQLLATTHSCSADDPLIARTQRVPTVSLPLAIFISVPVSVSVSVSPFPYLRLRISARGQAREKAFRDMEEKRGRQTGKEVFCDGDGASRA